jgi:hypothetical protein
MKTFTKVTTSIKAAKDATTKEGYSFLHTLKKGLRGAGLVFIAFVLATWPELHQMDLIYWMQELFRWYPVLETVSVGSLLVMLRNFLKYNYLD